MTPLRMLVVDDEASLRSVLTSLFESMGHTVRSAADGFAALIAMKEQAPNLILCDLNMAGMSGFEFLSVVRRRFPIVPVIAMSGAFSGADVPSGVAANAFYEKGGNLNDLIRLVKSVSEGEGSPGWDYATKVSPVWIPSNGHDPAGAPYVIVSCPDCLRTFPQAVDETNCAIHGATCVHCQTLIQYAIVPAPMPRYVRPHLFDPTLE